MYSVNLQTNLLINEKTNLNRHTAIDTTILCPVYKVDLSFMESHPN